MSLLREIKPRTPRIARILAKRAPHVTEPPKRTLLLHGPKCPSPLSSLLTTLAQLTAPHSVHLHKKNENIHPFDKADSLEFLARKNECGIWVFGSHSKKRPCSVTIGRVFGGKVLEMGELGMIGVENTEEGQVAGRGRGHRGVRLDLPVGVKPMIVFSGSVWEGAEGSGGSAYGGNVYAMWKSLFLDLFRPEADTRKVDVEGLSYVLLIAAGEPTDSQDRPNIHLRWYQLRTVKSGQKLPEVRVTERGPKFDFEVGRWKEPDEAMWKQAMKKAKGQESGEGRGKKKNVGMDGVGDKMGRVHLGRQDLGVLQTRKMKGLKRREMAEEEAEADDVEMEDEGKRKIKGLTRRGKVVQEWGKGVEMEVDDIEMEDERARKTGLKRGREVVEGSRDGDVENERKRDKMARRP